jgi:hypothetical protein
MYVHVTEYHFTLSDLVSVKWDETENILQSWWRGSASEIQRLVGRLPIECTAPLSQSVNQPLAQSGLVEQL